MEIEAMRLLEHDAQQIKDTIEKQTNRLCISQCKAFEEVMDTQMYGFSCKVDFAVRLGVISATQGQLLMVQLEHELNAIYEDTAERTVQREEKNECIE